MSTLEGRNRIDLNSLLQRTQQRMVAELTGIRRAVDRGGTLGDETELAWLDFLARVPNNRYRVTYGFVVDADGRRSDPMDIIVATGNTRRLCSWAETCSTSRRKPSTRCSN